MTPDAAVLREPTVEIVRRIRSGDDRARDFLVRRYLPVLRRWARGRLPTDARSLIAIDFIHER